MSLTSLLCHRKTRIIETRPVRTFLVFSLHTIASGLVKKKNWDMTIIFSQRPTLSLSLLLISLSVNHLCTLSPVSKLVFVATAAVTVRSGPTHWVLLLKRPVINIVRQNLPASDILQAVLSLSESVSSPWDLIQVDFHLHVSALIFQSDYNGNIQARSNKLGHFKIKHLVW